MGSALRLTSLMLGGTLFGGVSFCFLFLKYRNIGYGYPNFGDWLLSGAMTGAILGLGAELLLRVVLRPRHSFSVGDLLVAMTLIAAAVVVIGGLVRWLTALPPY